MGLDKLILPDGRNRLGGYMTTVLLIGITTAAGMNQSIMRVRINVYQMEKLPYLVVRAHYHLPE